MVDPELIQLIARLNTLNPQWEEAVPGSAWRTATLSNGLSLRAYVLESSVCLVVCDEEGHEIEHKDYRLTEYSHGIGSYNSTVDCAQGYTMRSKEHDSAKYLDAWLRPQFEAVDNAQSARENTKRQKSRRRLYHS